jgi:hypothetical protein
MADLTLTDDEATELWSYVQGAQFSGAARRKLFEFSDAHGWTDAERDEVTASLPARVESITPPPEP